MLANEILKQRLRRIDDLQKLGAGSGLVSPALAQFLLGVSRSRMRNMIADGRLRLFGKWGFVFVSISELLEYAKTSSAHRRQ
jgi:hypothetical protein